MQEEEAREDQQVGGQGGHLAYMQRGTDLQHRPAEAGGGGYQAAGGVPHEQRVQHSAGTTV